MSIRILSDVLDTELPQHKKLLLAVLADYANDDGFCFPKQSTIARRSSSSVRQVRRVVESLESDGWVAIVHKGVGRGRSTEYQLNSDRIHEAAREGRAKGDTGDPLKMGTKGTSGTEKGDTEDEKGDIPHATNRQLQPSSTPTVSGGAQAPAADEKRRTTWPDLRRPEHDGTWRGSLTDADERNLFDAFAALPDLADRIEEAYDWHLNNRSKGSMYLKIRNWLRRDLQSMPSWKRREVASNAPGLRFPRHEELPLLPEDLRDRITRIQNTIAEHDGHYYLEASRTEHAQMDLDYAEAVRMAPIRIAQAEEWLRSAR